jgi:hypothetical protein
MAPNTPQSSIPRRRRAITDLERRNIRASSLSTKTRDLFLRQLTNPAQKFSLFTETAQIFQLITRNSF